MRSQRMLARFALATGFALLLPACVTFSADSGMSVVRETVAPTLDAKAVAVRGPAEDNTAREAVRRLLARTLSADAAVKAALLGNRDLQASFNELGIAEAAMVQASLPPDPVFSLADAAGGGGIDIERRVVADILALATLAARADIAGDRFRQAQLRAALDTLRIAASTRRAYYRAVAARAVAKYLGEAQATAASAAEVAQRLGENGALNKLDQARNQVFYAEVSADLARARRGVATAREELVRKLGLWDGNLDLRLPDALPPLPATARTRAQVEVEAVRRRVDLRIARLEVDALAKSYGLTNATRYIDLAEISGISNTMKDPDTSRFHEYGAGFDLQVPLFDFGEARLRSAEAAYMQAVNRLSASAVTVRSQAREAYQAYRASYDIARHYQREVLPLRKIISDETLLRYNAMQIDVFALLVEARQRIASTEASIRADEEFWLADTELGATITGGGNSEASREANADDAGRQTARSE